MKNNKDSDLFPIGVVAKSFGVSDNAIRRMEAAGLLTPAVIKPSGYRYYDNDNISRIKMILNLRSLGLVYEDMREYFKNPGDFTSVYSKLFEKKLALDALLEHSRHYIRPDDPGEIFYVNHQSIFFFKETYHTHEPLSVGIMEEFSSDIMSKAVEAKAPIDYGRPVTILTTHFDYKDFNPYLPQELTFCVPLREPVYSPDTTSIPPRTVLSFAWYNGMDFRSALDNLEKCMANNGLMQCDTLAATFEIGKHVDSNVDSQGFLFHIMVPCEKV